MQETPNPNNIITHSNREYSFLIRLQIDFISPYQLSIIDPNGQEILLETTFMHNCIFENQLRNPPPFTKNSMEFIDWFFYLYKLY